MVRLLRASADGDQPRSIMSLSAVGELIDAAEGAGIEVTTEITATSAELSDPVDAAAYRVIQESITNVVRHSSATRAQVRAALNDGHLHVSISDDGRGPSPGSVTGGHGMAGMTERVRLLGGSLTTHSSAEGGFTVEAVMPTRLP